MTDRAETIVAMIGQLAVLPREEALARVREVVAKHEQAPQGEPSDEEIDSIAASMPDGLGGMLKQWGYRQFARALLARYAAPQADTWPGRFFGVDLSSNGIEDVRNAALEEAANLMDEDGRRSAAVLIRALKSDAPIGDAAQAQPKRRPYNASGSLGEYGIFPECDAAPAAQAPATNADAWKAAVDHELTAFHSTADSFANPREAVRALIDWHISVERDRIADLEAELEERIAEQKTAKEYARAAVLADREAQQQDELDAARYRLLRKGAVDGVAVVRGLGSMDYGMSAVVYTHSEEIDGDDLDAAIDAAVRKEGEQ
jgi:hypothetical protein